MVRVLVSPVLALLVGSACSQSQPSPVSPSSAGTSGGTVQSARPDSHGHKLTAVVGEGEGIVNVTPESSEPGFSLEGETALWKTKPFTVFNVKRAADFAADGVCTSNTFIQAPLPNPGPLATLTTSAGGAGSTHQKFESGLAEGTRFDVRVELSTPDSSIVLRTDCFTVEVK